LGLICRSSRSSYRFWRNLSSWSTVWTSVASPPRPTKRRSFILNTLRKSQATVWAWTPRRVSAAMATQSLPAIAIIAAPLYSRMDILGRYLPGEIGAWMVGSAVQQGKARHGTWGATKNEAHGERWRDGKRGDCQKERGNWLHGTGSKSGQSTGSLRRFEALHSARVCIYFFFLSFPFALRSSPAFFSFSFKAF